MGVPLLRIEEVVGAVCDHPPEGLHEVGRGAWSTAYRFGVDGRDLVVRVGRHAEDFEADRVAAEYRTERLPIPALYALGPIDDEFFCISDFAPGRPLEMCDREEWRSVVPMLVDALEEMRTCRAPAAAPGRRPWHETLLALDDDHVGTRLEGWRESLRRSSAGVDAFAAGVEALARLDLGVVEATLTHGDLINRNVHVDRDRTTGIVRLTGIFDWGCMRWGDHLYDLAWFHFWAPWFPELDVELLRDELDRRWHAGGIVIERRAERERACLTHIGLDHLVYNASIEGWSDLDDVVHRMGELDLI